MGFPNYASRKSIYSIEHFWVWFRTNGRSYCVRKIHTWPAHANGIILVVTHCSLLTDKLTLFNCDYIEASVTLQYNNRK